MSLFSHQCTLQYVPTQYTIMLDVKIDIPRRKYTLVTRGPTKKKQNILKAAKALWPLEKILYFGENCFEHIVLVFVDGCNAKLFKFLATKFWHFIDNVGFSNIFKSE